jgi:hypothetical protein
MRIKLEIINKITEIIKRWFVKILLLKGFPKENKRATVKY